MMLSVDQSFRSTGWVLWKNGEVVDKGILSTGNTHTKAYQEWDKRRSCGLKYDDTIYYMDTTVEQIHVITDFLWRTYVKGGCSRFVYEGISYGSFGDARASLIVLHKTMREVLINNGVPLVDILEVTPTELKAYARGFLPLEEQTDGLLKNGKPNKVKMDKKLVIKACIEKEGEVFFNNCKTPSRGDLADAYFIGKHTVDKSK